MINSFVYCWTDHKTNMLYIGYHKGELNDGYICSSKWMLSEYKKRPNDFTRKILAIGSTKDMINFETTLLKEFKVKNNPVFYNLSENNPPPKGNLKKNRIPWNKGKKGFQIPWNKGLRKELQPKFNKPSGMKGKKQSKLQKQIARETAIKRNSLNTFDNKCPHCDYIGYYTERWHWAGCKNKIS